jgi:hypothetical protein
LAGETEVLGENLPRRHFVHQKSYLPDPVRNPGRRGGKPATYHFSYGTATHACIHTYLRLISMEDVLLFKKQTYSLRDSTIIEFLDTIHRPVLYLFKTTFRRLDFVSVLKLKPAQLGSIDRASPYLGTLEPTHDRTTDNAQQHNNCINTPSLHIFRSYSLQESAEQFNNS